jgi:hypothetical protein
MLGVAIADEFSERDILSTMKLRLDLLEHLTAEDILEEAIANVDRYKPKPLFSQTGVGYLRPATPAEKQQEIERSERLLQKLKELARRLFFRIPSGRYATRNADKAVKGLFLRSSCPRHLLPHTLSPVY